MTGRETGPYFYSPVLCWHGRLGFGPSNTKVNAGSIPAWRALECRLKSSHHLKSKLTAISVSETASKEHPK